MSKQIEKLEAEIDELREMVERLCDELEGTHEHIDNIETGDQGGCDDPADIVEVLRRDMPVMKRLNEIVIEQARKLLARPDKVKFPHRRHVLTVEFSGDSDEALIADIKTFLFQVETEGLRSYVMGGDRCSHFVDYSVDESVTHESYFQALEVWMKRHERNQNTA